MFTQTDLADAIKRGIRQFVVINSRNVLQNVFNSPKEGVKVFAVDEEREIGSPTSFVLTQFDCETLPIALARSDFNRKQKTMFLSLGGPSYRHIDAILSSFAFIASMPPGSELVFDYIAERAAIDASNATALDPFASRISLDGEDAKHIIRPNAVAAMLRGVCFHEIIDLCPANRDVSKTHLVIAKV